MSLSIEDKLLLRCSKINIDSDKSQLLKETLHRDLNWDYILKEAQESGVSSLLYRNLKDNNEDNIIPGEVIRELRTAYFNTTANNIFLLRELNKILNVFVEEKISVMALKGAALLEAIYGDIGLRPMGDIDLLIKKNELHRIDKNLKKLGFSPLCNWLDYSDYIDIPTFQYTNSVHYIKGQGEMPVVLDLHWHIIGTTVPIYSYGPIDVERLWQGARQATIAGVRTSILAPHHLLIHLSEHMLRHSYDRSILFCDIFEAINCYSNNGLDWESLIQDTVEFNLNKPGYYGLYFTSRFLDEEMPEDVLARLKPSHLSYVEKKIHALVEKRKTFPELAYLSYFAMNEKPVDKLRFVFRSIFPSRTVLAQLFKISPQDIKFYHYILRARNAFIRGLRFLPYLRRLLV